MVQTTRPKRRGRIFKWLAGLGLILAFLMISIAPDTPLSDPPNAGQIMRFKEVARTLRDTAGQSSPQSISLSWDDLGGAASLAARTARIERVAVAEHGEGARISASIPLALGLWANVKGDVASNPDGFPKISGRIGWLPVPAFIVRFGIWTAEQWLLWRGIDAPVPDGVVHQLSFNQTGAFARVRLPKDSKLYRTLNEARSAPVDTAQVVERYCSLAAQQRQDTRLDLTSQVRRAFAGSGDAEANKAALVALAMIVVTPDVGTIAGDVRSGIERCQMGEQGITLLGRQDLAKHWTLSAALAAVLGADVSEAMGTWKEVADSGPNGSGFSFVDLAADRSGVKFGRRAADGETATETAARLAAMNEQQILPIQALALSEGLTEAQFATQFVDIDSAGYAAMVARIDRVLQEN